MPIRVPKDRKGNPTGRGANGEALRLMSFIKAGTDPRAEKAATIASDTADRAAAKVERQRQQVTGLRHGRSTPLPRRRSGASATPGTMP
ncbi:MAG: hypothetical protein RLZZ373_695 [Pseudomonadota bacterium]|jgi:hypothetical protein